MLKRLLSTFALCAIVLLGFVDPADASPMGPPSVECQLNGGEWIEDECICVYPEETTTTVKPPPTTTITFPEPTTTTTEPTTTTTEQSIATTVPESTTTVPTTVESTTTTTAPPVVVVVPQSPPNRPELPRTGPLHDLIWGFSAGAWFTIAAGAAAMLGEKLFRRLAARCLL